MNRKEALKRTALLMGGGVFAPHLLGIINGCKAESGRKWIPNFFSSKQAQIVSELAEAILPRDEHPGAKELGVPAFIEKMVADVYTQAEGKKFVKGLMDFNALAMKQFGNDYFRCTPEQRQELAEKMNREAVINGRQRSPLEPETAQQTNIELIAETDEADRTFFLNFKELTILGYFTTQTVCTEVIKHDPIPGTYDGCVPYEEIGSVWAEG